MDGSFKRNFTLRTFSNYIHHDYVGILGESEIQLIQMIFEYGRDKSRIEIREQSQFCFDSQDHLNQNSVT